MKTNIYNFQNQSCNANVATKSGNALSSAPGRFLLQLLMVAMLLLVGVSKSYAQPSAPLPALTVGDYRSNAASVNINAAAGWNVCTATAGGGTWMVAVSAPATNGSYNIWVQSGQTLTIGASFVCKNLCVSTAVGSQAAPGVITAGANLLTISNSIYSFYGTVVAPTVTFQPLTATTGVAASSYIITSTAAGGITFTGASPTVAGAWSNLGTTTWRAVFANAASVLNTSFSQSFVNPVTVRCRLLAENMPSYSMPNL